MPVDVAEMVIEPPGVWICINAFLSQANRILHIQCGQDDSSEFVNLNKFRIQSRGCLQQGNEQLQIEFTEIVQRNVALEVEHLLADVLQ
jgi:hypothetical protein